MGVGVPEGRVGVAEGIGVGVKEDVDDGVGDAVIVGVAVDDAVGVLVGSGVAEGEAVRVEEGRSVGEAAGSPKPASSLQARTASSKGRRINNLRRRDIERSLYWFSYGAPTV